MWRRAKLRRHRRAAISALAAAVLLVSACSVQAGHSRTDPQWRTPPTTQEFAAANTARPIAVIQSRSLLFTPVVTALATGERRQPHVEARGAGRREGSLPPARQRYRRVVHDDGEPPA